MANKDLSGYQSAYQQLLQQVQGLKSDSDQARQTLHTRLGTVGDQFTQLWTNLVGRAPTEGEVNDFYHSSAGSIISNSANGLGRSETDPTGVRNQIAQYVGDTGQKASQDYATSQLEAQQGKANELSQLFRTQGNTAISGVENSLLDYQQRLFERLRPNLITSLQAQGLLNTGGFNEAMAGQQADLANEGSKYIADLKYQNDQGANAIAYGGAEAPYLFKQGAITQQPNNLLQAGQNALTANTNTFMSNLDYTHQLGLLAQQNKYAQGMQPSFLRTFGQSAASSLGSNFNIPSWISATSGAGKTAVAGTP